MIHYCMIIIIVNLRFFFEFVNKVDYNNLFILFICLYTLFIQKFQFSIADLNGDLYKMI